MPRLKCRSCGRQGALEVTVIMHRKGYADGWSIIVCKEDLKILETMLDEACAGRQWGFPTEEVTSPARVFF